MEEKIVTKNASAICPDIGVPDANDIELISRFMRKTPEAKDIYTFSVILCDNEIDRDNERFSLSSLEKLREMFVGVTGIFDHSMKSSDQTARVYKTEIVRDETRKTAAGEVYTCLKAGCYMLRTDKNSQLINEIDGGIKKEVSISCSVENKICSVCGKDIRSRECNHISGKNRCHVILDNPTDAYEWSFVAVPAQRNAGVSKSVKKNRSYGIDENQKLFDIIGKAFGEEIAPGMSQDRIDSLECIIKRMKEDAELGRNKRAEAEKETIALAAFTLPDSDTKMMASVLSKLTTDEVMMLHKSFRARAEKLDAYTPDFISEKTKNITDNSQFRI